MLWKIWFNGSRQVWKFIKFSFKLENNDVRGKRKNNSFPVFSQPLFLSNFIDNVLWAYNLESLKFVLQIQGTIEEHFQIIIMKISRTLIQKKLKIRGWTSLRGHWGTLATNAATHPLNLTTPQHTTFLRLPTRAKNCISLN